jgi:hypothetical protein
MRYRFVVEAIKKHLIDDDASKVRPNSISHANRSYREVSSSK